MRVQKQASAARKEHSNDKGPNRDTVVEDANTDRVALRAYERFLARGCEHGRDLEDWLEAEREIQGGGRMATASQEMAAVNDSARRNPRRKPRGEDASPVSKVD